jgi:hypothetical protein
MDLSNMPSPAPAITGAGRTALPALGSAGAPVRFGRAGAIYDLAVTVAFATPWTAAIMLDLQRWLHTGLGAAGSQLPDFGPVQMLFMNMAGTVVTMWAIARILHPVPALIAIDTIGRVAFSVWMIVALASGASAVIAVFLVLEVMWAMLQGAGLLADRRAQRAQTGAPEAIPARA